MLKEILKIDKYYKICMIIGILVGIFWIIAINTQPFSDFQYYKEVATNIAQGGAWGNTYTAIGYSIILALFYKVFGVSLAIAKILNLFLYTLNGYLMIKILKKLPINNWGKKIIFTTFLFFPNNIFYISLVATELMFTFVLLLSTYIYLSDHKYKYYILGILTAIGTMIKPFFIAYFFAIFLVELFINKKFKSSFIKSLTVLVVACIAISPWIYRNSKYNGQLTYVSNNSGIVLYINNNSQNSTGMWMPAENVENSVVKRADYKNATMTEKNKLLSKAAKKWIKSHPKQFFLLGCKRILNTYFFGTDVFYSLYGSGVKNSISFSLSSIQQLCKLVIFIPSFVMIIIYSFIELSRIIGGKITDIDDKFNLYTLAIFYMFTFIYFCTEGQGRYCFPIIFIFLYYFYILLEKIYIFITKLRRHTL